MLFLYVLIFVQCERKRVTIFGDSLHGFGRGRRDRTLGLRFWRPPLYGKLSAFQLYFFWLKPEFITDILQIALKSVLSAGVGLHPLPQVFFRYEQSVVQEGRRERIGVHQGVNLIFTYVQYTPHVRWCQYMQLLPRVKPGRHALRPCAAEAAVAALCLAEFICYLKRERKVRQDQQLCDALVVGNLLRDVQVVVKRDDDLASVIQFCYRQSFLSLASYCFQ